MRSEAIQQGRGATAAGDAPGRLPAVLLLGPTGAGKTPLGRICAQRGLWGRSCTHVDFGACLRRAAAGDPVLASGLIDYYTRRGAARIDLPVSIASTADELYAGLAACGVPAGLANRSRACS